MTRNEMKKKLAETVVKAKTVEALELVQKKMELLGFTDLVFEDTSEGEKTTDTPWGKEGVSRGTYYRNKRKESNTVSETELETDTETTSETTSETVEEKAEVPQRVISKNEEEKVEGDVVKLGAIEDKPIKGTYWLNPDGEELTWDDITHRMIFDTEDDARSACYQVGKNYLDYVWIQNPETKQYFTGGELSKKE